MKRFLRFAAVVLALVGVVFLMQGLGSANVPDTIVAVFAFMLMVVFNAAASSLRK